jgi:hypothetical protein
MARRRPGIAAAEPKPLTSRPPLTDRLVLRVERAWKPDTKYAVEIRGLRNVTGVAGNPTGVLTVSKAPAPDSLRRAADSLKRTPPDSLGKRAPRKTP